MQVCNRAEITDILANWDQVLQVRSCWDHELALRIGLVLPDAVLGPSTSLHCCSCKRDGDTALRAAVIAAVRTRGFEPERVTESAPEANGGMQGRALGPFCCWLYFRSRHSLAGRGPPLFGDSAEAIQWAKVQRKSPRRREIRGHTRHPHCLAKQCQA